MHITYSHTRLYIILWHPLARASAATRWLLAKRLELLVLIGGWWGWYEEAVPPHRLLWSRRTLRSPPSQLGRRRFAQSSRARVQDEADGGVATEMGMRGRGARANQPKNCL